MCWIPGKPITKTLWNLTTLFQFFDQACCRQEKESEKSFPYGRFQKVELQNVAQAVLKITMDMEDQEEVVVLHNIMGQV